MNSLTTYSFDTAAQPTLTDIEAWLMRRLAQELEENEANLDPTARFASYGLDSMSALVLTGELEEWLDLELPSTLVWDFPTARELAVHLHERLRETARVAA
jgi:acyl carrier protein